MYKLTKNSLLLFFFSFFLIISTSTSVAQKSDIVGITTAEEVRAQHRIFDIYTKRYTPKVESVQYLKEIQDSVKIHVLFGTWCHDSKKQIPAFMKTMEEVKNPFIEVEYIAVTKKKTDPNMLSERWNLKYTPTFIIFRKGQEFGRIIEEPIQHLEEDLVSILKSEAISEH
tara:strand:+ start:16519 stop:17028 length:510 start_codon:yes stop_codon:yes gene_type:complete